jgi:hypothetical protein
MEDLIEACAYQVSTCFACQVCFRCGTDLTFDNDCGCDKEQKVPVKKKASNDIKHCVFNCRCDPNNSAEPQAKKTLFSQSVKTFGYDIDLSEAFSFYICSNCNNSLARMTREERRQTDKLQQVLQYKSAFLEEGETTITEKEEAQMQPKKQPTHRKSESGKKVEHTQWATHSLSNRNKKGSTDTVCWLK